MHLNREESSEYLFFVLINNHYVDAFLLVSPAWVDAVDNEEDYSDHLTYGRYSLQILTNGKVNKQGKLQSDSQIFRRKNPHEFLWLRPDDPPLIRRQLLLYDWRMIIFGSV